MQTSISTETKSVDLSAIDSIFGTGINDVLIAEEPSSPSLSTANNLDNKLDNLLEKQEEVKIEKAKEEIKKVEDTKGVELTKEAATNLDNVLTELIPEVSDEQKVIEEKKDQGRPKTDKNALASYIIQKIEANDFGLSEDAPFDAKKQTIEQYITSLPEKELHNILDTNWKVKEEEIRNQTPAEFYDALPDEAKAVAEYASKGGNDWKAFYQAMGKVEEVRALDPDKEEDQIQIARSYLQAKRFSNDSINEQIEDWKDAGKIEKKAKEFKPQLDAMQKEQVDAYNRQAEEQKHQQQELAKFYAENVYKALENNELAGIKLDKKFAKDLAENLSYSTMVGPWTGRPTNLLGYGLEKCQYVEPDYEALAIATWILTDKKAALEGLKLGGKNEAIETAAKLIKLNQGLGASEQPVIKLEERKTVKRIPSGASLKR